MGAEVLLNQDDPSFAFEHAMAHRRVLGIMSPLDRFSIVPYFIDPMDPQASADGWHLNHQQAHNDSLNEVPTGYGATEVGLRVGQNLVDTDLTAPQAKAWWTFQNHMEHYVQAGTFLPATTALPAPQQAPNWRYPFW
jgi:hypothetical protein